MKFKSPMARSLHSRKSTRAAVTRQIDNSYTAAARITLAHHTAPTWCAHPHRWGSRACVRDSLGARVLIDGVPALVDLHGDEHARLLSFNSKYLVMVQGLHDGLRDKHMVPSLDAI